MVTYEIIGKIELDLGVDDFCSNEEYEKAEQKALNKIDDKLSKLGFEELRCYEVQNGR